MKIQFIIEGNKYQEYIREIIQSSKAEAAILAENKKTAGSNNYILSIHLLASKMVAARRLSEVAEKIVTKLSEHKIKFYMLTDEPSATFVNRLYPHVCEFEIKLRKLVYLALFDLDESATKLAIKKIKSTQKKFSSITAIPDDNFLETITLGNLFDILFDNSEFTEEAKKKTSAITNDIGRTATKAELIDIIENIEEKNFWNILFAPKFPDFSLPAVYRQISYLRNDVMHFHRITYKKYLDSLELIRKINKELDVQLDKCVVLENTKDKAKIVSLQYFSAALSKLSESVESLQVKYKIDALFKLIEITNHIPQITYEQLNRLVLVLSSLKYTIDPTETPLGANNIDEGDADDNDTNDDGEWK